MMKGRLSVSRGRDAYESARDTLLPLLADESAGEGEPEGGAVITKWNKTYTRCPADTAHSYSDSPTKLAHEEEDTGYEARAAQQRMLGFQDEQLEAIARSAGGLNSVARHIGRELDDHVLMLEDINSEMENVESKLDSSMRQVARVLRVNNGRRQWIIIGCLAGLVFLVLILFIIL